jgi:sugar phosphate isomerase/epimerase
MGTAIVGYTGFVGLNLQQFFKFNYFYNSKNFKDIKNKSFDTLFFGGIPSVKWYANKNPEEDNNIIENIKVILNTIKVKKFILISTIDVYEDVSKNYDEDYKINPNNNHTYGKNRFFFEKYVEENFENYNIIRLPALFGKGLKKNIIYDLIHNNNVNNISLNSSFQWYYLEWLKRDIDIILKHDIKVCNLFTEPINTNKIIHIFNEVYNINYEFQLEYLNDNKTIKYDLYTKNNKYFNCNKNYIIHENEVIKSIKEYLLFEKKNKCKLCVSNICVNSISQIQLASILKLYGIKNIQIAPTKLIKSWDELEKLDLSIYKNLNLNIYSFQSITYTLNDLNIFDKITQEKLYKHFINVIDYAEKNKVSVLVFGCPRNRRVLDTSLNNKKIFIDFFKNIGDYLNNKNLVICIENNSKQYQCNFINTIKECSLLVREIDKDNIKMMVDLGNAVMENDDWYYLKKHMDIIYNIDVSQPLMSDFLETHESNELFNFVIKNNNYDKMINLEFLIQDKENELEILTKSLTNFINIYSI